MEIEGVVQNGVIVPDDPAALPEGSRVRITFDPVPQPGSFAERYAQFKGAISIPPKELARQHENKTPTENPLRGSVLRYDNPTDPVAEGDWDALR